METKDNLFYTGTSGLLTPIPKRDFPANFSDKSRLSYYASLFNSIEINSSFYKIPLAKTLSRWADSVPDNFRFTFKLWQGITHAKHLNFNVDDVNRFVEIINNVQNKKGCLLIQFPAGLHISAVDKLSGLLKVLQEINKYQWKIAVEFRNNGWYNKDVHSLLENYKAGLVMHDFLDPVITLQTGSDDFVYLRFHGTEKGYKGSYSNDALTQYARFINNCIAQKKTVFAYFNNTAAGDALNNLTTLNSLVNRSNI